jgi:hypothetical protein
MGFVMGKGNRGRRFEDLSHAPAPLFDAGGRAGGADRIASGQIVPEEDAVAAHVPDA